MQPTTLVQKFSTLVSQINFRPPVVKELNKDLTENLSLSHIWTAGNSKKSVITILTLTRPIGLLPHAPIAQKIADQRWLIANLEKVGTFFI